MTGIWHRPAVQLRDEPRHEGLHGALEAGGFSERAIYSRLPAFTPGFECVDEHRDRAGRDRHFRLLKGKGQGRLCGTASRFLASLRTGRIATAQRLISSTTIATVIRLVAPASQQRQALR